MLPFAPNACLHYRQNFAAIKSLTTTGIQKGHMKMHLLNILNHLNATEKEIKETVLYFKDRVVSFSAVRDFLDFLRGKPIAHKEEHSETPYTFMRAIEVMEQSGDEPWCLHLSVIKPHWPIVAPAPYHNMYDQNDFIHIYFMIVTKCITNPS